MPMGFASQRSVRIDSRVSVDGDGLVSVSACVRQPGGARGRGGSRLPRCGYAYEMPGARLAMAAALRDLADRVEGE